MSEPPPPHKVNETRKTCKKPKREQPAPADWLVAYCGRAGVRYPYAVRVSLPEDVAIQLALPLSRSNAAHGKNVLAQAEPYLKPITTTWECRAVRPLQLS